MFCSYYDCRHSFSYVLDKKYGWIEWNSGQFMLDNLFPLRTLKLHKCIIYSVYIHQNAIETLN